MSGPVDVADLVEEGRTTTVGSMPVRRVLPRRTRRTVGAWCFVDHMGPLAVPADGRVDIGPHPHLGLHTVTWLLAGELVHHDSLGSEQTIRPGQLNLMTAGRGIAHAEESTSGFVGDVHGVQLWVAQPESTRHGAPAFEHHGELPEVSFGAATATVLVGSFGGAVSPARADSPLVGVDVQMRPGVATWAVDPSYEHALVVLSGTVAFDESVVVPGQLGYLAPGREQLTVSTSDDARLLLLGGTPFEERVLIWWNYVARTTDEIDIAGQEWNAETDRFGHVETGLARIPSPIPPWRSGPA